VAMEDTLRSLREFDVNDLDLDNVGSWPNPVKAIVLILLFAAVLAIGYYYHIEGLQAQLAAEQNREVELRQSFEKKAFEAANLDAYRKQMVEMEQSFGALISQLPSNTEVPGLLEDITNKGLLNGLEIASIDLRDEVIQEFYVELPIGIEATGTYHDLGAFVSGMAGLPRIVTLHDFSIEVPPNGDSSKLKMSIVAKTYRYRDGDGDD
jgi:type IV pilus assembly protein PilO